jgi:hypothetical protein
MRALPRERLDMRCPRGARAVLYRQARREMFALHGECKRWDGAVEHDAGTLTGDRLRLNLASDRRPQRASFDKLFSLVFIDLGELGPVWSALIL